MSPSPEETVPDGARRLRLLQLAALTSTCDRFAIAPLLVPIANRSQVLVSAASCSRRSRRVPSGTVSSGSGLTGAVSTSAVSTGSGDGRRGRPRRSSPRDG